MPASSALFGSSVTGPGSTHGAKHLIEQKAGRMHLKGKMVYPDKRKGMLYIYQSDDSLMHFCWKDRTTGVVEDDLIIFPDDCEYVRVPQCTTGRVYLLKFKSSNRRYFFWLQEPRTDKDEESCKKINDFLNNPPGPGGVGSGNSGSSSAAGLGGADQDLQSLLNNMSQTQLLQLFGGVGQGLSNLLGTMSRPNTGGNTRQPASTPSVQRYNSTTTPSNNSTTGAASTPSSITAPTPASAVAVDLSSALTTEALSGILNDSEALNQLQEHLPDVGGSRQDQLRSTLQSPQFQQAVSMFSSALQSGQLAPVVEQFSVNPEAVSAASQGDLQGFVQALEKGSDNSTTSSNSATPKADSSTKKNDKTPQSGGDDKKMDDDEDEGMQLG